MSPATLKRVQGCIAPSPGGPLAVSGRGAPTLPYWRPRGAQGAPKKNAGNTRRRRTARNADRCRPSEQCACHASRTRVVAWRKEKRGARKGGPASEPTRRHRNSAASKRELRRSAPAQGPADRSALRRVRSITFGRAPASVVRPPCHASLQTEARIQTYTSTRQTQSEGQTYRTSGSLRGHPPSSRLKGRRAVEHRLFVRLSGKAASVNRR